MTDPEDDPTFPPQQAIERLIWALHAVEKKRHEGTSVKESDLQELKTAMDACPAP
jgi:hypothetical protein